MIGVPQLFEDRWQQGGGGNTPPAAPVKRGRGRPRKHPLPQDKGGGTTPRRPTKGSRRLHTDDEWSDWNESSYDTWQPEWTPTNENGVLYPPPHPNYSPAGSAVLTGASTPTAPGSPMATPLAGPPSSLMSDLATPQPDEASDWRDEYCYSMTYDVNYILSTTSPENTQVVPRLPPTTDQSGNKLFHWHANPPIPRVTAHALYAITGYDGACAPAEEPPPPSPSAR